MTTNTQPPQMHPAPESVTRKGKASLLAIANEYGNVDVRTQVPKRYAHVPGKYLPSLCRKLGIKFAPALVGFKRGWRGRYSRVIDGVVVSARSAERVQKGIAERACASAPKAEAKKAREALLVRREAKMWQQIQTAKRLADDERWAEHERRDELAQPVSPAGSNWVGPALLTEPTLDLYTAEEWARFGYSVSGEPLSLLIQPGGPAPLYDRSQVSAAGAESNLSAKQLWHAWRQQYATDLLAATKALQAANKLVKIVPNGHEVARELYPIKDTFIRRWLSPHLVSGRVSRVETRECWGCASHPEPGCGRCGYTGVYSSRTLYEHHFLVDGHEVCFHTYQRPARLDTTPGADLRQYGVRWALAEIPELRLSDFVRLLRWVLPNVLTQATIVSPSAAR